ncbi:MAG TPA: LacI family DNA-binding transcriptional regulator [Steroidobacteraceae bacterium]|jgi:DNA-binding LacI/PurR family transcriptional regulator|nr:LacI family DNA-binding transcriptional regulator [Steroidobacteraceae bacterium]
MVKANKVAALPPRRATLKEVAKLAGVSTSAVSRTFTPGASVAPETRMKVLAATRSVGYQPNALARSLMTRRTELIGLVANNFDNPVFMEIFDLFTRRLQTRGRRPLLANLSGGASTEAALEMLLQYSVDGVIVASSTLPQQFVKACADAHLPVVHVFGRPTGGRAPIHVVSPDNVQGGRLAGEELWKRGYRNIAFLGGPQTATSTEDRLIGLGDSLSKHRLKPRVVVYGHAYSHEAGLILMRQLLRNGGIDAVFCGDDNLAMGAMDACREAGVDVPNEMGIIGFNDMAIAAWPAYHLTTIHQPTADIISAAVELVLSIVEKPVKKPMVHLFDCRAVIRGTLRAA